MFIEVNNVHIAFSAIDHVEIVPETRHPGRAPEAGEAWDPEYHAEPSVSPAKVVIHTVRGLSYHESDPAKVARLIELLNTHTAR